MIKICDEYVKGENWMRVMLYFYEYINDVFGRMKGVSVDIELFIFFMFFYYCRCVFEEIVEFLWEFDVVLIMFFYFIVFYFDRFE